MRLRDWLMAPVWKFKSKWYRLHARRSVRKINRLYRDAADYLTEEDTE